MPVTSLANFLPINITRKIDPSTVSGLPTAVSSPASVKDVVIVTQGSIPVAVTSGSYFYAYSSVNQALPYQAAQDVVYDTIVKNDPNYTLLTTSGVRFNVADTYRVTYYVTTSGMEITEGPVGNQNRGVMHVVQEDTGSGFVDIPGTASMTYPRMADYGTTASCTFIKDFAVGDIIKQVATYYHSGPGDGAVNLARNGVGLVIRPAF